jgi:hypothetical protein
MKLAIPAEYLYRRRPWKSEQQHINEYLYCHGLPYRQNDMTNLHDGMRYIGSEPAPVLTRQMDGSIVVNWSGVPSEPREIVYRKRPVKQALPWAGGFA